MSLKEKFYVGQPLKIKGIEENFYGRYYESGYECYNIPLSDSNLISLVTPDGHLISGSKNMVSILENEEFIILKQLEQQYENPYSPRLIFDNNKYYKSEEYNKKTIDVSPVITNKIDQLCSIDKDIFSKALINLFSIYYEKEYFLNDIVILYRGKIHSESEDYDEFQKRYTYFISSKQYPEIYCLDYDHELYNPYKNAKLTSAYYQATDYTTMFQQKPIDFNEEEYLLYFSNSNSSKIKIGCIKGNKFIPGIDPIYNLQLGSKKEEIFFDNSLFSLADDFIVAIMNYKIKNNKLDILEEDMEKIISEFDIEKKVKLKQMTKTKIDIC